MRKIFAILFCFCIFSAGIFAQQPSTTKQLTDLKWQVLPEISVTEEEEETEEALPHSFRAEFSLPGSKPKLALPNYFFDQLQVRPLQNANVKKMLLQEELVRIGTRYVTHYKRVAKRLRVGHRSRRVMQRVAYKVAMPIYGRPEVVAYLSYLRNQTGMRPQITSVLRTIEEHRSLSRHNGNAAALLGPLRTAHTTGFAFDMRYRNLTVAEQERLETQFMQDWKDGRIVPTKEFVQKCYHIVVVPKSAQQLNQAWVEAVVKAKTDDALVNYTLAVWKESPYLTSTSVQVATSTQKMLKQPVLITQKKGNTTPAQRKPCIVVP